MISAKTLVHFFCCALKQSKLFGIYIAKKVLAWPMSRFWEMKKLPIGNNIKSRHLDFYLKKFTQIKSDLFMHNHKKLVLYQYVQHVKQDAD